MNRCIIWLISMNLGNIVSGVFQRPFRNILAEIDEFATLNFYHKYRKFKNPYLHISVILTTSTRARAAREREREREHKN